MSLARFVNVILGASPAFPVLLLSGELITTLLFIATTLFLYILSISIYLNMKTMHLNGCFFLAF